MILQDSFTELSGTTYSAFGQTYYLSQTFTASSDYNIASVKLFLIRSGASAGVVTVEIRTVDGSSPPKPTSTVLCSSVLDVSSLISGSEYRWIEFTFSSPAALTSGAQYAIVASTPVYTSWWRNWTTNPSYTGGNKALSTNSGSTWTSATSVDLLFETYSPNEVLMNGSFPMSGGPQISGVTVAYTLVGSIPMTNTVLATLIMLPALQGTLTILSTITGRLTKLFKTDKTVPIRRLVVAAEHGIWYEVI